MKAIREMENRVGSIQLITQIGNQIGGQEEAEPSFREEAQRGSVRVQDGRIHVLPVCHTLERRNHLERLLPFDASLQKRVAGMRSPGKGLTDVIDYTFFAHHAICIDQSERRHKSRMRFASEATNSRLPDPAELVRDERGGGVTFHRLLLV